MAKHSNKRFLETGIEALAVLGSLLYTFRYLNGKVDAFLFGGIGALLFVWLCWKRKIFAESFLQLFYVGFAVYGYMNFGGEWHEESRPALHHALGIATCAALVGALGFWLKRNTESKLPYLDAFTTVFSLWTTWLMVNFVHENWLYWMVIDVVAIGLYAARGMYLGALLFVLYTLMAIAGYWRLDWFTL